MDIVVRRPTTKGTFVDMVLPVTASLTDQRRWLLSSLRTAREVRGTSLFSDSDTLVYVDGEEKFAVGKGADLGALVDEVLPEDGSDESAYGDGN